MNDRNIMSWSPAIFGLRSRSRTTLIEGGRMLKHKHVHVSGFCLHHEFNELITTAVRDQPSPCMLCARKAPMWPWAAQMLHKQASTTCSWRTFLMVASRCARHRPVPHTDHAVPRHQRVRSASHREPTAVSWPQQLGPERILFGSK